eukprot:9547032-Ditylum_brightwellii.AAC.1
MVIGRCHSYSEVDDADNNGAYQEEEVGIEMNSVWREQAQERPFQYPPTDNFENFQSKSTAPPPT